MQRFYWRIPSKYFDGKRIRILSHVNVYAYACMRHDKNEICTLFFSSLFSTISQKMIVVVVIPSSFVDSPIVWKYSANFCIMTIFDFDFDFVIVSCLLLFYCLYLPFQCHINFIRFFLIYYRRSSRLIWEAFMTILLSLLSAFRSKDNLSGRTIARYGPMTQNILFLFPK